MLVFMGDFGAWAQVWSKGSCVGKVGVAGPIPASSSKCVVRKVLFPYSNYKIAE